VTSPVTGDDQELYDVKSLHAFLRGVLLHLIVSGPRSHFCHFHYRQMMGGAPNASALDAWGSAKGKGKGEPSSRAGEIGCFFLVSWVELQHFHLDSPKNPDLLKRDPGKTNKLRPGVPPQGRGWKRDISCSAVLSGEHSWIFSLFWTWLCSEQNGGSRVDGALLRMYKWNARLEGMLWDDY